MKKLIILFSLFLSHFAFADGDKVAGQKIVEQVCAACHGLDGQGTDDTYPKLAGQFADYIEVALADYKSGARKSDIMSSSAETLSEQDIANVATYYSTLTEHRLHDLSIK